MFVLKRKESESKRHITVRDLDDGDVFLFEGNVYLMIDNNFIEDYRLQDYEIYCLSLEDSTLSIISVNDYVALINKDIIIDYTNEDLKEWVD